MVYLSGVFLLALFILFPVFEIRLLITGIVLIKFFNSKINLSRFAVFVFLFIVFLFAYFFSPYWNAYSTLPQQISIFILTLIAGLCWSFFSSSSVRWNFRFLLSFSLILLSLFLYLANYLPLHADIAYRGDEDYHINVIMDLFDFLKHSVPIPIHQVTRYPLLFKWIALIFILPNPFVNIALYRIIPFLSTILLAWLIYFQSRKQTLSEWKSIALALAVATLPSTYFFSSLLYMEMPIILLMTYVIFQAKQLIGESPKQLKSAPLWYALLIISFIKETALVFLVVCMGFRMIYQLYHAKKNRQTFVKTFFTEVFLTMLVIIPNIIFQYFRWRFPVIFNNPPDLTAVKNLSTYPILFIEYCRNFGVFLIPVVLGLAVYFLKREYQTVLLLIALLFSEALFFLIMRAEYVGYARFSLFLLPVFIPAAIVFFKRIGQKATVIVLAAILICNIILSPIHPDGTRLPNWGSPTVDTAEYTYPYDKAFKTLSGIRPNSPLIVLGRYYLYFGLRYYYGKYQYQPPVCYYDFHYMQFDKTYEKIRLDKFFSDYKLSNLPAECLSANVILYHSVNNINLNESVVYGDAFKIFKRIKNTEHSIYLFRKI